MGYNVQRWRSFQLRLTEGKRQRHVIIRTLRYMQRTVKETAMKLTRDVWLVLRRVLPDRRSRIRMVAWDLQIFLLLNLVIFSLRKELPFCDATAGFPRLNGASGKGRSCTSWFERLFVISWENNRDCHITMPLSLKTMEVQIKGDLWNKRFRTVQVYCRNERGNCILMTSHNSDLVRAFGWLKICFIKSAAIPRSG